MWNKNSSPMPSAALQIFHGRGAIYFPLPCTFFIRQQSCNLAASHSKLNKSIQVTELLNGHSNCLVRLLPWSDDQSIRLDRGYCTQGCPAISSANIQTLTMYCSYRQEFLTRIQIKFEEMVTPTVRVFLVFLARQSPRGPGPPHSRGFQITHNDAPPQVELLWMSDQLVAQTSTLQRTTLPTDRHPCPLWDSNPKSQQTRDRRPTPQTARPLGAVQCESLSIKFGRLR